MSVTDPLPGLEFFISTYEVVTIRGKRVEPVLCTGLGLGDIADMIDVIARVIDGGRDVRSIKLVSVVHRKSNFKG